MKKKLRVIEIMILLMLLLMLIKLILKIKIRKSLFYKLKVMNLLRINLVKKIMIENFKIILKNLILLIL